jgi:uncharacterized protein (TIGR00297 family)
MYLALLICLALGVLIYKKRVLDALGTAVAVLMGILVYFFAGYKWLTLLLCFLFLGFATTKYKYSYKKRLNVSEPHGGRRKAINVIANGALPTVFAGLYYLDSSSTFFLAGYLASVATVTADTLSSELGVLSRRNPVLITTLKEVPHGTNGGVTLLGELAGIGGALFIGIVAYTLGMAPLELCLTSSLVGGILGFNFDSLLGATFERRGLLSNAGVNFLSSLGGGLFGAGAALYLLR